MPPTFVMLLNVPAKSATPIVTMTEMSEVVASSDCRAWFSRRGAGTSPCCQFASRRWQSRLARQCATRK